MLRPKDPSPLVQRGRQFNSCTLVSPRLTALADARLSVGSAAVVDMRIEWIHAAWRDCGYGCCRSCSYLPVPDVHGVDAALSSRTCLGPGRAWFVVARTARVRRSSTDIRCERAAARHPRSNLAATWGSRNVPVSLTQPVNSAWHRFGLHCHRADLLLNRKRNNRSRRDP